MNPIHPSPPPPTIYKRIRPRPSINLSQDYESGRIKSLSGLNQNEIVLILAIRSIAMLVFTCYGFKKNPYMFLGVSIFSSITYVNYVLLHTVQEESFLQQLLTLKPDIPKKCPNNSCSSDCADTLPKVFGFKHKSQVIPLSIGCVVVFAHFSDNHKLMTKVYSAYTAFLFAWKISYIVDEVYKKKEFTTELI